MDEYDVMAVVDSIAYKPGWTFRSELDFAGGVLLTMTVTVPDARPVEGAPPDVHFANTIRLVPDMFRTVEDLHSLIVHELWRIEYHEMREWYTVNGVCYDNPHAITRV